MSHFRRSPRIRKVFGWCLSAALCFSAAAALPMSGVSAAEPVENVAYPLAENCQDGVTLHCFSWPYKDITASLPEIAQAGFTSVQVSSIQSNTLSIFGPDKCYWAAVYAPIAISVHDSDVPNGYNRADLEELCREADKYGIHIIMDVVVNHCTRMVVRPGDPLYDAKFWHGNGPAQDYTDRKQVTDFDIAGDDLRTEEPELQQMVVDFLKDLESIGVDGIRWDSAKHISLPSEGSQFWATVTDNDLYHYGEILTAPVDGDKNKESASALMKEYTDYMPITDNIYSEKLLIGFRNGKAVEPESRWLNEGIPANRLVFWGESHDTYCNDPSVFGEGTSTNDDQNIVDRTYAVGAAREGASALYFSRPKEKEEYLIVNSQKGSTHFASPEVSAVNHFHNAMIGKKDCVKVSNNCEVITRENGGAVIVCGDGYGEVTVENAGGYAVPGTYVDEVSGNTFVVTEETITGTVGQSGIAVLYDHAPVSRLYAETENGRTTFYGKTNFRLNAVGMKSATYMLSYKNSEDMGLAVKEYYNDGDVFIFNSDCADNSIVTLTLEGVTNEGEEISAVYSFLYKEEPPIDYDNVMPFVLFDNSAANWDDVYVYAYVKDGDSLTENAAYPGVKATYAGNKVYTYDLTENLQGDQLVGIIFNDGKGTQITEGINSRCFMPYLKNSIAIYLSGAWMASDGEDMSQMIQIPPTGHNHTLRTVPAKDPTGEADGNIEYTVCDTCGKLFSDAAGLSEITDPQLVVLPQKQTSQISEPSVTSDPSVTSETSITSQPAESSQPTVSVPVSDPGKGTVATGDSSSLPAMIALIAVTSAAAVAVLKKKSHD